ncbi:MAG: Hsp33 family molecular chaperone HslO [Oscillospiraceae bacterium]|nr:Hsp33 family molecular chaperone HslO [Oscillospiraceae bacterium]
MQDHIIRAISRDGFVKAMAISSTQMVERARNIHKTTPTATAALGRVLTVCSMMGNLQKVENGALTLQFKGGGPLGTILATSDSVGNVRGYVHNPGITLLEKYAGKLDVGAAVGTDGMLTVIRDLQMKEPYIGSVQLVSGEIADDITAYFAQSEQTPTACALGVLVDVDQSVKVAGGYLIQLLPGAPDDIIDRLEAGIQKAGAVTPMLSEGLTPREILERVMDDFDLDFFETTEVAYRCYCSRDRVSRTLITVGRKDLQEIIDEGKPITIECQFCDTTYEFSPEQVSELLQSLDK